MTYCRKYCDEPPEEVDKCEALRPQIIRMNENLHKLIHFKLFRTCESIPNNDLLNSPSEQEAEAILPIPNFLIPNDYGVVKFDVSELSFRLIRNDGLVIQIGNLSLRPNDTFDVYLSKLEHGNYYLQILYDDGITASRCIFPVIVCK